MNPKLIPCRMCQAGPGELCKYKGKEFPAGTILGGHDARTPKSYRCYHYKRVVDAQWPSEMTRIEARARARGPRCVKQPVTSGCRWRA